VSSSALPDLAAIRSRFPGIHADSPDRWARFDGPAGTQMVDTAIRAMSDWSASGNNANTHGPFPQTDACDALLDRARASVGLLLGADPNGVCLGANMTTMTMAFSRAVEQTLRPGDNIVGTRLDHDANVSPWRIACERSGATHRLAGFDPATGVLSPAAVIDLIDANTKWVTLPGASNLIGTMPDLAPIIAAAHDAGARVFIDAVALAPHHGIDITALGCDVLATSPYKWYGPHAGVLWCEPSLLDSLPVAKVRPADPTGPRRFETGTPNFEGIAAVDAAARFRLEEGMDRVAAEESAVFGQLLDGIRSIRGARVHGIDGLAGRVPTLAFTVDGFTAEHVAHHLAGDRVAVWAGHSYAVEVVDQLGLTDSGGVVRAGVVRYIDESDVNRMLESLTRLTT
jgi:cysteine desulfurase family protein (TIGR01976 family)